ncbi:MAG: hypothetical protein AAGK00_07670 [Pseudomonadota bacterium]
MIKFYGMLGGFFVFLSVWTFIGAFWYIAWFEVVPAEWFPPNWFLIRYILIIVASTAIAAIPCAIGVYISRLGGEKKEV